MDLDRVVRAVTSDVSLMTSDRINALTGGHGGIVFAGLNAANRILLALESGANSTLQNLNACRIPLDEIIRSGVDAALAAGSTPSNAALITAMLLYFTGTHSRSGIPAANRKLGAPCRLRAGAERGGVCQIPTPKMGNKISGFPAVEALYRAIRQKKLTRVDGHYLPMAAYWGTAWGHSTLGEDIIIPEVAKNGARVATRAMTKAYEGVGTAASRLFAAIFGAAAVAEVIHGDAAAPESFGPYDKSAGNDAIRLVGLAAAEEAELPPELHVLGSRQTFETAKFVGDVGLILKDIGSPTVVGMIWLSDLLSCFEESPSISCTAIGPVNPPFGHTPTQYLPCAMQLLRETDFIPGSAAGRLRELLTTHSLDSETTLVSTYIVARKSSDLGGGPVTDLFLEVSRDATLGAVRNRAEEALQAFRHGESLGQVVRRFEKRRQAMVEETTARMVSQMLGRNLSSIRYTRIEPQARRSDPITKKYLAFDARFDVEVTLDGKRTRIEHLFDRGVLRSVLPHPRLWLKRAKGRIGQMLARRGWLKDLPAGQERMIPHALAPELSAAVLGALELTYAGCVIINITVPTAVAAALGKLSPIAGAECATSAAYVSSAIPGALERARSVAELVLSP